jgi:hypothetical protein
MKESGFRCNFHHFYNWTETWDMILLKRSLHSKASFSIFLLAFAHTATQNPEHYAQARRP